MHAGKRPPSAKSMVVLTSDGPPVFAAHGGLQSLVASEEAVLADEAVAHTRRVDTVTIATLDVANLLSHIDSKPDNQQLIICDSRRADVILSVLVAARLKTVAGLLLTGFCGGV